MYDQLQAYIQETEERIKSITPEEAEKARVEILGRKSYLAEVSSKMRDIPPEQRGAVGKLLNEAKQRFTRLLDDKAAGKKESEDFRIDLTVALEHRPSGSMHPVSSMLEKICSVFTELRFGIYEGQEIEDEFHNFEALNIATDHPSREDFDTFYLRLKESKGGKRLLRSHTSPSQIHVMQKHKPPFAFIVPGKVYRPDAVDASHSYVFHQVEGFAVGRDINFSHLKGVLYHFAQRLFGEDCKLRFRPSFFPFTEPSAEVDVSCFVCKGKGCPLCSRKGWLEVLGCGMIHPHVLQSCSIDPQRYQGFAFGMGVERLTLLKLGINDIRLLFENDERFLEQFYEV